jgi:hypothetical protein
VIKFRVLPYPFTLRKEKAMKVWAVVLAVVLVGAVAAQAGNYSAGFWLGHRALTVVTGTGSFTPGILELGGQVTWQVLEHLALRGSFAYNTGSFTQKEVRTYIAPPGVETFEDKDSFSGFPIEFNILPTFKIGEKLILRAGGGLAYHSYSDKYTFTYTSPSGVITTTTFPSAKTSGFGSQFLLCSEGKITNNVGVEIQYKKDAGSFNYSLPRYTYSSNESREEKATFGSTSDTYRISVTFAF